MCSKKCFFWGGPPFPFFFRPSYPPSTPYFFSIRCTNGEICILPVGGGEKEGKEKKAHLTLIFGPALPLSLSFLLLPFLFWAPCFQYLFWRREKTFLFQFLPFTFLQNIQLPISFRRSYLNTICFNILIRFSALSYTVCLSTDSTNKTCTVLIARCTDTV